MKYPPVKKRNPIIEILFLLFIVFFCSSLALNSNGEALGILWAPVLAIIIGLCQVPDWLKWYQFQSSIKETTEARIVDRRVEVDDFKGPVYTYYVTYQFYTLEDEEVFEFEEKVDETLYNSLNIGTLLAVEYAINDPRLARSSLPKVKNDSWEEPLDDNNDSWEETPTYN